MKGYLAFRLRTTGVLNFLLISSYCYAIYYMVQLNLNHGISLPISSQLDFPSYKYFHISLKLSVDVSL